MLNNNFTAIYNGQPIAGGKVIAIEGKTTALDGNNGISDVSLKLEFPSGLRRTYPLRGEVVKSSPDLIAENQPLVAVIIQDKTYARIEEFVNEKIELDRIEAVEGGDW